MATPNQKPHRAIILAAGSGRRLASWQGPKVLLQFAGRTLLERHVAALEANGIAEIAITVGYQAEAIALEIERIAPSAQIQLIYNPDYLLGSMVSLWHQRAQLSRGDPVLLMDGDVLYGGAMIPALLDDVTENRLLLDRNIEPGDEPVKVCFRGGDIVDFRKVPVNPYEWFGESVGFFLFSGAMSGELARRTDDYIGRGQTSLEYEEAIRDLIISYPDKFGAADITSQFWTEIDFDCDVERAERQILPNLEI
ncbi:choline kinase [Rhizobium sp. PP-F2F-G36]|nr:choline kinase [Rhizobium sp. PP-F2F-G36]